MKRLVVISMLVLAGIVTVLVLRVRRESGAHGQGADLLVYCAAGAKPPVLAAARQYESEYGVRIRLQYGGSGTLLSNLQVSRAGDLYLAADSSYTAIGREKGVVAEVLPLATITPVIAVHKDATLAMTSLRDLLKPGVRVALGNAEAASIGKQTRAVLERAGLWASVEAHVRADGVFKPTVPEIANDVAIGAVDVGIIWDATANQHADLRAVHLPELDRARKEITIGVLNSSERPTEALRFARYLNSRVGNALFKENGYQPVDGDVWAWRPEITFFCGAVNRRAVEPILTRFQEREDCVINTVYNGCGILTGQMRTIHQDQEGGAFPDVYMACDRYYLDNVAEWFQEDRDISSADIVIAVPKGNPGEIRGLADLATPGRRVSVGQPRQCTIGALTRILLEKEGLYAAVMSNVVMQTASSSMLIPTVTTRSVDATLAYATDTQAEADKVDVVPVASAHARAVQPFSLARSSGNKYLGRRLLAAVAGAREAFEEAGFHFQGDAAGAAFGDTDE